jgi:methionyl-tRNA synthetase
MRTIGKDIIRSMFHRDIWPSMLFSAAPSPGEHWTHMFTVVPLQKCGAVFRSVLH